MVLYFMSESCKQVSLARRKLFLICTKECAYAVVPINSGLFKVLSEDP
ncbi:hypothetical protein C4K37_3795 [Pseudomonas chlororaphis subsp. piscium]|nr:hypothetical protein C4K37_3795 [Pseudomonas chlororaphis subsp. piscium]AZC44726.1 hypothetical protein C4K36_3803 [Pseudomonas chlororaphis subsp. piscium]